ncbi:uncharacterized protein VTP21DRAFT_7610 [Calcarisporiella thermophila]|uniref:uncharacterized protein n=1 Tax=Calcarisporiella thermophila TaxID=911321 RepID=UPI00374236B9
MAAGKKEILTTYRRLLREVNLQFVRPTKNTFHRHHLSQSFRQPISTEAELLRRKQDAEDVLLFLESRRKHSELLERYSPVNADQAERIELAAKRVGLNLPRAFGFREEAESEQAEPQPEQSHENEPKHS